MGYSHGTRERTLTTRTDHAGAAHQPEASPRNHSGLFRFCYGTGERLPARWVLSKHTTGTRTDRTASRAIGNEDPETRKRVVELEDSEWRPQQEPDACRQLSGPGSFGRRASTPRVIPPEVSLDARTASAATLVECSIW